MITMKTFIAKTVSIQLPVLGLCIVLLFFPAFCLSGEYPDPLTYLPSLADIDAQKKMFDDPRPWLTHFGPKQLLPDKMYEQLTYDVGSMKKQWSDLVGFTAPGEVGKISPEIKPGKYICKDLDKYPGLRKLFYKDLLERIKPGGPPFAGSIPEFEIIPTRQYYWSLPISELTKKNLHRARLDEKGYIIKDTWEGGYPFPRPEGKFKAQQIMYNVEKRYVGWGGDCFFLARLTSYTKSLRIDFQGIFNVKMLRLAGRCLLAPYGYYDEGARKREEVKTFALTYISPRDFSGGLQTGMTYNDSEKPDALMVYMPWTRKVRKLAPRDTQDDLSGQGRIYDDWEGFMQKISPARYPYRFELIEEREYLVPAPSLDGAEYVSSEGAELKNIRFERRPIYVIKMTQLDPGYVYGSRIFYIDKETFLFYHIENYDQKGRLYRTRDTQYGFFTDSGMFSWTGPHLIKDHINMRSNVELSYSLPSQWRRRDVNIEELLGAK